MHWIHEQAAQDRDDDVPEAHSLPVCEFCGAIPLDFGHAPECGDKARAEARRLRKIVHDAEFGRTGQPMQDFG